MKKYLWFVISLVVMFSCMSTTLKGQDLKINKKNYFERQGLNVIVLEDVYPEGHQGGITIIQHGKRVAANGNLSLQPVPGQWEPHPKLLDRKVLNEKNEIIARLKYPDSTRITTNEQPIIYPDFEFEYELRVVADGENFRIIADLDKPLLEEWVGKVGLNIELFPGNLFGKTYAVDNSTGIFSRNANTPVADDGDGEYEALPMAEGKKIVVAPEDPKFMLSIECLNGTVKLLDGRVKHNNGWFVVRSLIPAGKTKNAVEWLIKPNVIDNWIYTPVIHNSQVGYHSDQSKLAVVELDKNDKRRANVEVYKITSEGGAVKVLSKVPETEEDFLRYVYASVDFTEVKEPGMYFIQYGDVKTTPFKIGDDVYKTGVWQPTLEYFLPVQMCHMKVFEKYRVWHDLCHLDDAMMAPENINHFDVYTHGELPEGYEPFQHIEGLDVGGWHDAGDLDFRIESQLGTVLTLAYAYEEFGVNHDQTLINQEERIVEIHHPDGKPDVLQQIEHGLLTILAGYREFGEFYRGILCPTLRQYAMLGDARSMTDNEVFTGEVKGTYDGFWYDHITTKYDKYFSPQKNKHTDKEYVEKLDDRLVFLEDNPGAQVNGISALAASARVLKGYNDEMANEALKVAEEIWRKYKDVNLGWMEGTKVHGLAELILTTNKEEYKTALVNMLPVILKGIDYVGWTLGRVLPHIDNNEFVDAINKAMAEVKVNVDKAASENPFGIPYHPDIWGAGWGIQSFGFQHYFLYTGWSDIFTKEPMLNALNFVLGCHPGENTASFVSSVGSTSQLTAYGINRVDWSYIPGGVISGTNIVRPDLPELLDFPFLWQQAEYVIGGGASHFMFLTLAADKLLSEGK